LSEDGENSEDDADDTDDQPRQSVATTLLASRCRKDKEDVGDDADEEDDFHHAQYGHGNCNLIRGPSTVEMGEEGDERQANPDHLYQGQNQFDAANDESAFSKRGAPTAEAVHLTHDAF